MASYPSFDAFAKDLNRFQRELSVVGAKKVADAMGVRMQAIAAREASADLGGDPKFSGWEPTLDTRLKQLRPGSVLMTPTKVSAGPWTVLQSGRNHGHQGFAGPGINRRTGRTSRTKAGDLRKVRQFKGSSKRYNGVTSGKGTADRVHAQIERELQSIAEKGVLTAVKRFFNIG